MHPHELHEQNEDCNEESSQEEPQKIPQQIDIYFLNYSHLCRVHLNLSDSR